MLFLLQLLHLLQILLVPFLVVESNIFLMLAAGAMCLPDGW